MFIRFLRDFNLKMCTASLHEGDRSFTIFQLISISAQKTLAHFFCVVWIFHRTEVDHDIQLPFSANELKSPATVPITTPNTNETNYVLTPGEKPTFERPMIPRTVFLNIPSRKLKPILFPWQFFLFQFQTETKSCWLKRSPFILTP